MKVQGVRPARHVFVLGSKIDLAILDSQRFYGGVSLHLTLGVSLHLILGGQQYIIIAGMLIVFQ